MRCARCGEVIEEQPDGTLTTYGQTILPLVCIDWRGKYWGAHVIREDDTSDPLQFFKRQ